MMIKPKGRPSTTCDHCKELRKNKNANPSGVCTCGRLEKKRLAQRVKEEARAKAKEERKNHECRCDKNEPCRCHSTRRRSRKISMNDSQHFSHNGNMNPAGPGHVTSPISVETYSDSYLDSDAGGKISKDYHHIPSLASISSLHSTQSLDQKFNFPQSPTLGNFGGNNTNGNWDSSSICSSVRSESRANLSDIVGAGLDPSKRVAPMARSRVGEVTVPLEEYIPSDINGIGRINDVNSFDDWSPDSPATNMNPSVSATYAQSNSNSTNHQLHSLEQSRSSSNYGGKNNGLLDMFLDSPTVPTHHDKNSSSVPLGLAKRYSFHSPQDAFHHYKDNNSIKSNNTTNNMTNNKPWDCAEGSADNESVRSVEVLSLTPGFMDVPERKPSHQQQQHHHQLPHRHSADSQVTQQRSSSVSRNHRYPPSSGASYGPQPTHHTKTPPITVNPSNVSNVDDSVGSPSLQSPSTSVLEHGLMTSSTDPSLLKNLPEHIKDPNSIALPERSASTSQFQQPFQWSQPQLPRQGSHTLSNGTDINSEIDQLMAFDNPNNRYDTGSMSFKKENNNPFFQDVSLPLTNPLARRSLQDTSPASSNQTSSPPSQLLTEKGFADLDNFMSIL